MCFTDVFLFCLWAHILQDQWTIHADDVSTEGGTHASVLAHTASGKWGKGFYTQVGEPLRFYLSYPHPALPWSGPHPWEPPRLCPNIALFGEPPHLQLPSHGEKWRGRRRECTEGWLGYLTTFYYLLFQPSIQSFWGYPPFYLTFGWNYGFLFHKKRKGRKWEVLPTGFPILTSWLFAAISPVYRAIKIQLFLFRGFPLMLLVRF